LKRKIKEYFETNMKDLERNMKDSLGKVQKENRDQQTRLRTEKRIAELRLEQIKTEDKETEQIPHSMTPTLQISNNTYC
jgi:hypothetical protein